LIDIMFVGAGAKPWVTSRVADAAGIGIKFSLAVRPDADTRHLSPSFGIAGFLGEYLTQLRTHYNRQARLCFERNDWTALRNVPDDTFSLTTWQNILAAAAGLVLGGIGMLTEIGRPILLSLSYDVKANTVAELREIAVTGGLVGFLIGAGFVAMVIAGATHRKRIGKTS
jgi:hypothetical protein